jgi:filamentous hemagglutinin family protein
MNIENQLTAKSSRISRQFSWSLRGIALSVWMLSNPAFAQSIVTDGTTNTQINGDCAGSCSITGSDIDVGNNNLFHSFQKFNVDTGATVTFIDPGVINIISRVTGRNLSQINGILGATGSANLFLINASGILFGPNASLNIGGSFVASSADSLVFNNGQQFSAVNPAAPPLLTINVPVGLQFGANPSQIEVQGTGNNLLLNPDSTINRDFRPAGLKVPNGKTLALVGGDLIIEGGNLTAEEGRIELGSVDAMGKVNLLSTNTGWSFDYSEISSFNDIQLSQAASADVSGNNAGIIQVRGGNITLSEGSSLLANTLVEGGGEIRVRGEETVNLGGNSSFAPDSLPIPPFSPMPSSVYVEIEPGALGDGSSRLNVSASNLELVGGAQIGLSMAGAGSSGSLNVSAENVTLSGGTPFGPSSIFVAVFPVFRPIPATGKGGELTIDSNSLQVLNGSQIIASTFGPGDAGNLNINAQDIQVIGFNPGGPSSIVSGAEIPPAGQGGQIAIATQRLLVADGGQISTGTQSITSPAGDMVINASESIELRGEVEQGRSGLFASAFSSRDPETGMVFTSEAEGGSITVNTGELIVKDGATINVSNSASNPDSPAVAQGLGPAGNMNINAERILLDNQSILTAETVAGNKGNINLESQNIQLLNGSIISTNATEEGQGGNILIIGNNLDVLSNSQITSNAEGLGSAGNINIDVSNLTLNQGQITASGNQGNLNLNSQAVQLSDNSELSTNAEGESSGGNIDIVTGSIDIRENSQITANAMGEGSGGTITISSASENFLLNRGRITSNGEEGNIILGSPRIVLRDHSLISANGTGTGQGGNVIIFTDYLLAVPQENSDITANAENSFGGRVIIFTDGIFGIEFREEQTPLSDITVTSELGPAFSGVVEIINQNIDPQAALVELPQNVIDASTQIAQGCSAERGNVFTLTGRGGLPENPNQTLQGRAVWQDLRSLEDVSSLPVSEENQPQSQDDRLEPIIEAQGLIVDSQGKIRLVAQTSEPQTSTTWHQPSQCNQ